jgi:hypothetical protein
MDEKPSVIYSGLVPEKLCALNVFIMDLLG